MDKSLIYIPIQAADKHYLSWLKAEQSRSDDSRWFYYDYDYDYDLFFFSSTASTEWQKQFLDEKHLKHWWRF